MTVRVDYFGFAEGAAADARGSLTLVGFSPQFQVRPTLPATVNLVLVLVLVDDGTPEPTMVEGNLLRLDLQINDPDGIRMIGSQHALPVAAKKYPELPGMVAGVVGVQLAITKYGRHEAVVSVSVPDHDGEQVATRDLFVMPE